MSKSKALFLDRDGVLNKELGRCVTSVDEFQILDYNFPFLKAVAERGFLFIVISNQSCVDLGKLDIEGLLTMNKRLFSYFEKKSLKLSDIYFCPHHTSVSGKCLCRKPDSLLFEKAIKKYSINPKKSFMIGDKPRDIEASEKVGVQGILIESNAKLPVTLLDKIIQ